MLVVFQNGHKIHVSAKTYPNFVHLYSIEQKGLARARNFAIERSTGDYLVFLDDDASIRDDFKETVKMNRICLPDWVGVSIFYPYPGTKIYSLCQKKSLLKMPLTTDMERSRAILELKGFSRRQIKNAYVWFESNIYKGHKSLHKLLLKVIYLKIITTPSLFFLYNKVKKIKCLFME